MYGYTINHDIAMRSEFPRSTSGQSSLDVLFIDDSINLCRAMELWLTSSGYSALTATTAAEAEGIAILRHPRVIITDIGLPDGSGYELRRKLLETGGMDATHFIALSGSRGKTASRQAIESGFETFIAKPPDFNELAAVLRERLPGSRPDSGARPSFK